MSVGRSINQHASEYVFRTINEKSDRIMAYALAIYFLFGIGISFVYDTFLIAVGIGALNLVAYFATKTLMPNRTTHHYVLSAVFGIFTAQFIYQLHGLFEMHFFFFVGSALLITYRNWKIIIPLVLFTVIHHSVFAWLQYTGTKDIYFTQLAYMDLQAFIFHVLLAAVIFGICGYWSYDLGQSTLRDAHKTELLQQQVNNAVNNIAFAEEISKGNLNVNYALLDEQDELGKSLIKMRENLKIASEREQHEKFVTVGITRIGDIIRQHGDNTKQLAEEFISGLVKYTHLNQGGIFLLENEGSQEYLALAACYAYNRKKFLENKLEIGEGLVGQCFLEREPIYLTDVPTNYVRITSGLGEATPRCIYIVPIKTQEDVVGIIELASFNELQEFEKQFINKAAENIASAIVSARTTQRIKILLEESQLQGEQLRAQEEEMRQNMEELQATQEELVRKARQFEETNSQETY